MTEDDQPSPASKRRQETDGPMLKVWLEAENRLVRSKAFRPMEPTSENFGYSSAVATPISAVCAASLCSACPPSGHWRRRSAGTPTATFRGGIAMGRRSASCACTAPGGSPSSTANWFLSCSIPERPDLGLGAFPGAGGLLDVEGGGRLAPRGASSSAPTLQLLMPQGLDGIQARGLTGREEAEQDAHRPREDKRHGHDAQVEDEWDF